jgi:hypothetical protein
MPPLTTVMKSADEQKGFVAPLPINIVNTVGVCRPI